MSPSYSPSLDVLRSRLTGGERRAKTLGNHFEPVPAPELEFKLNARRSVDGQMRCYFCGYAIEGDDEWHLDHLDPLALGGAHNLHNLEAACAPCNLTKADLPLVEIAARLGVCLPELLPHLRLTARPVEEIWKVSPDLARRVARRPRDVSTAPWSRRQQHVEHPIVAALLRRPYEAVSLEEISAMATGAPRGGALLSNYWTRLMGLPHESTVSHKWLGPSARTAPSLWFLPTRASPAPGEVFGRPAFRLRFRMSVPDAERFVEGDETPHRRGQHPDRDEEP